MLSRCGEGTLQVTPSPPRLGAPVYGLFPADLCMGEVKNKSTGVASLTLWVFVRTACRPESEKWSFDPLLMIFFSRTLYKNDQNVRPGNRIPFSRSPPTSMLEGTSVPLHGCNVVVTTASLPCR